MLRRNGHYTQKTPGGSLWENGFETKIISGILEDEK